MPEESSVTPRAAQEATPSVAETSPLRALTGSLIAASLGLMLYRLMRAIATSFAAHPPDASNQAALNLSIAVRTLVVGLSALATGIFTLAAIGLFALALQTLWQRLIAPKTNSPS